MIEAELLAAEARRLADRLRFEIVDPAHVAAALERLATRLDQLAQEAVDRRAVS